jgi:hypothetical protein
MLHRRGFLGVLAGLVAAPAVVAAPSLMSLRGTPLNMSNYLPPGGTVGQLLVKGEFEEEWTFVGNATLTFCEGLGRPLTCTEVDSNFRSLAERINRLERWARGE